MASYSNLFRQALQASPEDRARQKERFETAKRERKAELLGQQQLIKTVTNTNLTKTDFQTCNWNLLESNDATCNTMPFLKRWSTDKNYGLFLWGPVGTAKTHMLKGMLIHLATTQELTGKFFSLHGLANKFRENLEYLEDFKWRLMQCDILVIDDMGAEKTTEFVQTELLSFLDRRHSMGKPIFMSSNFSPEHLKKVYDKRILDRLQQMMVFVEVKGESFRREIARRNKHELSRTQ